MEARLHLDRQWVHLQVRVQQGKDRVDKDKCKDKDGSHLIFSMKERREAEDLVCTLMMVGRGRDKGRIGIGVGIEIGDLSIRGL